MQLINSTKQQTLATAAFSLNGMFRYRPYTVSNVVIHFRVIRHILAMVFMAFVLSPVHSIAAPNHLYTTGPIMEIDRCGSAWLIKRYVDHEAVFRFFPEGQLISEGTVFDAPEAKLRRTHRYSTFETIMTSYKLQGKKLEKIASIIHDIEINAWKKRKEHWETLHDIKEIIEKNRTDDQRLAECLIYFDNFSESNIKETTAENRQQQ